MQVGFHGIDHFLAWENWHMEVTRLTVTSKCNHARINYSHSYNYQITKFTYFTSQTNITVIKALHHSSPQALSQVLHSLCDCDCTWSDCFIYPVPPKKFLWSNGLVVKVLDSQSRGPLFKTTGWPQDLLCLSSFWGQSNEYQEFLETKW